MSPDKASDLDWLLSLALVQTLLFLTSDFPTVSTLYTLNIHLRPAYCRKWLRPPQGLVKNSLLVVAEDWVQLCGPHEFRVKRSLNPQGGNRTESKRKCWQLDTVLSHHKSSFKTTPRHTQNILWSVRLESLQSALRALVGSWQEQRWCGWREEILASRAGGQIPALWLTRWLILTKPHLSLSYFTYK